MKTYFADIVLPLAVPNAFTYRIPQDLNDYIKVGMRVIVPFGRQKLMTGIVLKLHENPPTNYTAKYVDSILETEPVVTEKQIMFWEWMSTYYLCHQGEVLLASLPAGLRLSSESSFILNPAFDGDTTGFSEREMMVIEAISNREVLSADEVSKTLGVKKYQPILKRLLETGAVMIMEGVKERYTPKTEILVRLNATIHGESELQEAFEKVSRAAKQEAVLLTFLGETQEMADAQRVMKKSILQKKANATSSQVKALVEKGILDLEEITVDRIEPFSGDTKAFPKLSDMQEKALHSINGFFEQNQVTLLHGVTASGKTEVYINLIKACLDRGEEVLFMVPEIALTAQMIGRMQRHFGDDVLVYHSKFNQQERVEIWNMVLHNKPGSGKLILGARSAVFLPFSHLGLIVVDEEHESSYKQMDPAPRYNGRDSAIVLAQIHKANTLLGSATPSFESMHNAESGKYGYVKMNERFGGMLMPSISTAKLGAKNGAKGYFTLDLIQSIKDTLASDEQVILFQNRRGYSPVIVCQVCGWSPECTRCDVTTTFHKSKDRLVCHYCGNKYSVPVTCHSCGSHKLDVGGYGTERIEEEVAIHFPKAKIGRLDLDATRSKNAYQQIISDFQNGSIDILIGTQMVTKGLDFDRVRVVGILNADLLIRYPDFRSTERAFQLMTQVAGRAGRRDKRGKVIVQTYEPDQWIVQRVINGDYYPVFQHEMAERKNFHYPPYTRMISLMFRHKELELVDFTSAEYFKGLKTFVESHRILGPEYPSVARVKNRYHKQIILKLPLGPSLKRAKENLLAFNDQFFSKKQFRPVRLIIDVDPQ